MGVVLQKPEDSANDGEAEGREKTLMLHGGDDAVGSECESRATCQQPVQAVGNCNRRRGGEYERDRQRDDPDP